MHEFCAASSLKVWLCSLSVCHSGCVSKCSRCSCPFQSAPDSFLATRIAMPPVHSQPLRPGLRLDDVLRSGLCPKASIYNVSEYKPLADALKKAQFSGWSSRRQMVLFWMLRGVRGEEGVKLSAAAIFEKGWDVLTAVGITAFALHMLDLYKRHVDETKQKSFLSHAEGQHSGLSGANFLRTLLVEEQVDRLLCGGGHVDQLVPYWEKAAARNATPADLLSCFFVFQGSKFMIYKAENSIVKQQTKCIQNHSYNVMDFTRSFYNCWELVLGNSPLIPCDALWAKVPKCQSKPVETKVILEQFHLDTYDRVQGFLVERTGLVNWTTLLVLLCETRQASHTLGADIFRRVVQRALADQQQWARAIEHFTEEVKNQGARGCHCYCTRVCLKMQAVASGGKKREASDGPELGRKRARWARGSLQPPCRERDLQALRLLDRSVPFCMLRVVDEAVC